MADIRVLEGDLNDDVVVGSHRDGALVGVVGVGGPRTVAATARYRAALHTDLRRVSS
jgi:hypothetical protein